MRIVWLFLLGLTGLAQAEVRVMDDLGAEVRLAEPARRIVSLAPHATELLFAAGAGDRVVGVVKYSDYPAEAKKIQQVGRYKAIDVERIVALKPDLVVVWPGGNRDKGIGQLRQLGFTLYQSQPRELEQVAVSIEKLGRLAASETVANAAVAAFRHKLARLREQYSQRQPVSVFYQIWNRPLMTLGGGHLVSRVMELCGGRNAFISLETNAPKLDVEAVLAADPQAIVASGMGQERPEWLEEWRRWQQLQAVKNDQLFFIPPDLLQRMTPRILDGAQMLCEQLESVRAAKQSPRP